MRNDVNSLVVCRDDYHTNEEFEDALKKAIFVLLDNGYIMTVKYDDGKDLGIVAIDYEYANEEFGCRYPHWLLPEEEELLECAKTESKNAENGI